MTLLPQTPAPWFASTQSMAAAMDDDTDSNGQAASLRSSSPESGILPTTPLQPTTPGGTSPLTLSPFSKRLQKGKPRGLSLLIPERPAPKLVAEHTSIDTGATDTTQPPLSSGLSARRKKKPAPIMLSPPEVGPVASRSAPNSPAFHSSENGGASEEQGQAQKELSSTLRGAPRKRPSLIFSARAAAHSALPAGNSIPVAWRDPSEHPLTGAGSTLQHARSVYAAGPIEVLPGLFLGDEHNACDEEMLADFGITTILNVAKETTLPFQFNADAAPLLRGPHIAVPATDSVAASPALPMTGVYPPSAGLLSARLSAVSSRSGGSQYLSLPADGVGYLRAHTSTPNLKRAFSQQSASSVASKDSRCDSSSEDDMGSSELGAGPSPSSSSTPELDGKHAIHHDDPPCPPSRAIRDLPPTATALTIPPSPGSGRASALQYIKLPWTHDEVDLASEDGGFVHGCAVIADVLGLNIDKEGMPLTLGKAGPTGNGKVLVHCQCGVSRSATLVIAFVMQAAALGYDFEETRNLQGMHDCYSLVKEASSSISPNCSLIYQLVEWERTLSARASLLRSRPGTGPDSMDVQPGIPLSGGWTADVMGEDEWLRMRAEQEREEAEEQIVKQQQQASLSPSAPLSPILASPPIETPSSALPPPLEAPRLLPFEGKSTKRTGFKKPLPQLELRNGARARIDIAQVGDSGVPSLSSILPHLTIDRSDEDDADAFDGPLPSAAPTKATFGFSLGAPLNGSATFPPPPPELAAPSPTSKVDLRRMSRPERQSGAKFGAPGQSLAERRHKHKRTFSTDIPTLAALQKP